jgi:hypothetical protein
MKLAEARRTFVDITAPGTVQRTRFRHSGGAFTSRCNEPERHECLPA